jgi:DNA-binding NtrC family response regulator
MTYRHKPHQFRIVVIGTDISHVSSRANLLAQAGYNTDLVVKVEDAVKRVIVRRHHLAVVTSVVPYDEQLAIRARLKQVRPNLSLLLLGPNHDSPDALLAAVEHCLKKASKPCGECLSDPVARAVDPT